MENFPTWLAVVAAAIFDAQGRVLLQQRPAGKHHGGLWEFPGGKVETGESPRFALVREIAEELGIRLQEKDLRPALFAEEHGERHIVLFLYTVVAGVGPVMARDGQDWGWFDRARAAALPLAPMDRDLLERLSF